MKVSWIFTRKFILKCSFFKFNITLVAVGLASAQSQCKIDLPGTGAFEADTVLYDKITIGKQWYVYFEMKLTNTFNRWNDLIRIRTDSNKKIHIFKSTKVDDCWL